MPANARSLQLTDTYRQRKVAIVDRVQREARESWPTIDTLDGTKWAEVMASKLTRAQTEGIRLTAGYLTAYTASETGQRSRTAPISTRPYAGLSRDGRPLREALRSPLIGTLAALKDNPPDKALSIGLARALRMVGFEASQAPRDALLDTIESDDRFSGWNRAVAGTCAACMALSGTTGPHFEVHPGCQCEPEPALVPQPNQEGITEGRRAVDAVLNVPQIKVKALGADDIATARYITAEKTIAIGEGRAQTAANALTHEYGHAVDDLLGAGDEFLTSTDAGDEFFQALKNTRTCKAIRNDEIKLLEGDLKTRNYMLQGREMFARAFHQYVAIRSRNPLLLKELESDRGNYMKFTWWDDDEFEPIAELFDKLFAERGLAK